MFIEIYYRLGKLKEKLKISEFLQPIVAGILLICLTFIFSPIYLGLGTDVIETVLKGGEVALYAFLLKIIFTSLTLNFGGNGGELTPIFFIGATAGSALSKNFRI